MRNTKGTKQILNFKEVIEHYLSKQNFQGKHKVEYFEYKNDILFALCFYEYPNGEIMKIRPNWHIESIESMFTELDKLGYELDNAYSEFQDLIACHSEQLQ